MPDIVTGTGNTFNLPNFAGELFTASPTRTPFLSMIGGLSGGRKTDNDRFITGQLYEFPEPAQPEISEQASETSEEAGGSNVTVVVVCAVTAAAVVGILFGAVARKKRRGDKEVS